MADPVLLGVAFAAGIATVFSPCATALLPAYLSLFVTRDSGNPDDPMAVEPLPSILRGGLLALASGLGLLAIALVDFVVGFGDRAALDAALGLAGGLAASLGLFFTLEGGRALSPDVRAGLRKRVGRGLLLGGVASLGIGTVYAGLGFAILGGLSGLPGLMPSIAFASASVVVLLGVAMLLGRNPVGFVPRIRAPKGTGLASFFLFGAGYALVASGCFLPVFLQVIGAALVAGAAGGGPVILAYALGSAVVFTTVSTAAGAALGSVARWLRAWRPRVHRVAGVIVIGMGVYVLWYDWTFLLSKGL